jgi:hypothetical protein
MEKAMMLKEVVFQAIGLAGNTTSRRFLTAF